jgi:hypothetical protein
MENSFNIVEELPYVLSADADKDKRNLEATLCYETLKDRKILTS